MFQENRKKIGLFYIIAFAAIGIGTIAGALYYSFYFRQTSDVKSHLGGYVNSLKSGMDFYNIIKSSVKSYGIMSVIIIITSFLKFGPAISLAVLIRKGFVNAFTTAAMLDVYGNRGILLLFSTLPQILILVPALALFTSVSILRSGKRGEFEKRDKIIYIIFSMIIFTIFCICAIFEGLLTTTFMKWVAFKVT